MSLVLAISQNTFLFFQFPFTSHPGNVTSFFTSFSFYFPILDKFEHLLAWYVQSILIFIFFNILIILRFVCIICNIEIFAVSFYNTTDIFLNWPALTSKLLRHLSRWKLYNSLAPNSKIKFVSRLRRNLWLLTNASRYFRYGISFLLAAHCVHITLYFGNIQIHPIVMTIDLDFLVLHICYRL